MVGDEPPPERSARRSTTLIIPTFHEIDFAQSFDRLLQYLVHNPLGQTEILIVDDSSEDERAALQELVAERRGRDARVDIELVLGPRLGKGAAVREGALRARGDVVLIMDADLLVPFDNMRAFIEAIHDGADIVIGERPHDRYRDNFLRHFVSRVLYVIQVTFVFHARRFADTQCGFKAFRNDVLKQLASLQIVDGGIYDLEYLYAATLADKVIRQLHVEPTAETRPSRIDVWRCMHVDSLDIVRFKLRGLTGHYR